MNLKLATYLAFIFILGTGTFNIVWSMDNVRKRRANKKMIVLRFLAGILFFVAGIAFGYFFIWMRK